MQRLGGLVVPKSLHPKSRVSVLLGVLRPRSAQTQSPAAKPYLADFLRLNPKPKVGHHTHPP